MRVSRILPYYVGICIVSLFTGIAYETETFVLRPFDVMIGLGVFVLAGAASQRGYARQLNKGLPYYLFAALYLYRGLSGLVMTGPVLAGKELLQGLEFLFLIHLVVKATQRQEARRRFLQTLYVGFGIVAVVTALLHIVNGQYSGYKYLADLGYTAGGAQKYAFGLFGLMALVFWMGERKNAYAFPLLAVAILLCFLSGDRKGWVALAAGSMAIFYVESNFRVWAMLRNAFRARYLAVVGLAVVGGVVVTNYEYAERQLEGFERTYEMVVEADFDYVYGTRQDAARYNGLVFISQTLSRHPLFGVGTERGKTVVDVIPNPDINIASGHGEYQRYALENGIIGLFLYISIWGIIIIKSANIKPIQDMNTLTLLFIWGFIIYSIVINMFMGGGAQNIMFMSVSIGVLISILNLPEYSEYIKG